MSYFTTDLYETKRELILFSEKLSQGLAKPKRKFVANMLYGIAKKQSCRLSEISRALDESVKLCNTIDRLSDQISKLSDSDMEIIIKNYYHLIEKHIPNEPLINLDNSEIVKEYAKKLEDLDRVIDASSTKSKDIKCGYHVCEASVITKTQKQPLSLYSHIYSTNTKGFKSMNDETIKSIEAVKDMINKKCTFVMDRGYDGDVYYRYFICENENKDDFIIRLKGNRNLLFKGKAKHVEEIAKQRKGKIRMNMYFKEKDKEAYVSHTRVALPKYADQSLTLVMVYGLSEETPLLLLTNKKVSGKEDVHKIVRQYMQRWRIEEGFRFKKQEYGFEKMLVRSIHAMNVMNLMLMAHIGHIGILAEAIDQKLLVIKMIERSRSIGKKAYLWLYQIQSGIREILQYAHQGIREYLNIREKQGYRQMQLRL